MCVCVCVCVCVSQLCITPRHSGVGITAADTITEICSLIGIRDLHCKVGDTDTDTIAHTDSIATLLCLPVQY